MFKNRLLSLLVIVLVSITLIVASVYFFILYGQSNTSKTKEKKLTATEISDRTYQMKDILTNLKDDGKYIKISFAFQMSNVKAVDEVKQLDFLAKHDIIVTLNDLTPEQIHGSKGLDYLSSLLMNKINPILTKGKITSVYITDFVLQ